MAVTTVGASAPDSVEALKRVKAAENEWDARLSATRRNVDETLERLRAEAAAAVKETQIEAGRDRVARVVQARTETGTEAEAIVAEGRKAAEQALVGEGRRPADKKDAILEIVLGSFAKD
jgi:vacuolar-type H+-ATPase subunit H